MITLKNTKKKRTATPNEVAKHIIMNCLESIFYDLEEKSGMACSTEKERSEVSRFLVLHYTAIRKRLDNRQELDWDVELENKTIYGK